jgi:hypothetical protein
MQASKRILDLFDFALTRSSKTGDGAEMSVLL